MIHIAGLYVNFGPRGIQRCMVCGYALLNEDYTRMAVPEGMSHEPLSFATGAFVEVNGVADQGGQGMFVVGSLPERFKLEDIPEDCCYHNVVTPE